jgi:hypothetical protein
MHGEYFPPQKARIWPPSLLMAEVKDKLLFLL